MILLPIKKLKPGMVSTQSVYNKKGESILTRGAPMTQKDIDRLAELDLPEISVVSADPRVSVAPPPDVVEETTRSDAIRKVYDTFHELEDTGELDPTALTPTAQSILRNALENRENLVQLTDIRLHDNYTFGHSVNVAVLSAVLGSLCNLSGGDLINLVMGALLHDIGKLVIPQDILTKPGQLSDQEFDIIQMHPDAGRLKLLDLSMSSAEILATIAGQHHEHIDGRGYPDHLVGDQIHLFARIVAIADVFDALTSARSYKPAYRPHSAFRIMTKCSPGQFDEKLLSLFFDSVAIYPVGTVLKTTLGYAIVKKTELGHTLTPTICVFGDLNGDVLKKPYTIDLLKFPPDTIISALEEMELTPLLFRMRVDPSSFLKDE
ncbi:MAG: HD-GYP domain-containing protein [Schwartzia sp.]|nr:HD-GYP domain-containing protein [Schwartzia sp. (in: firmicutes)]